MRALLGVIRHGVVALCLRFELLHFAASVVVCELVHKVGDSLVGVEVEKHPVYRLEHYAVIVDVFKLDKREAGGMILHLLGRKRLFDVLPICLCGRKRMVAVAHGEEHGVLLAVFGLVCVLVGKLFKRADYALYLVFAAHEPALDMSALLHELKVVKLFL